jgi:LacI family transcriptional regulator
MVTIKEVATKAGVSVGTVSNVLNDLSTVSEGNRKKVNEVIMELGYTPNKIAASLSNKKTRNIGLVVTDISSPFYSDLIKAITETLETYGYNVFLCGSDDDIAKEEKLIKNLLSMWVDGIILIPSYTDRRDIHFLNSLEIPLVVVNREIEGFKKDIVVFDNFKGAYEGVRYLIKYRLQER